MKASESIPRLPILRGSARQATQLLLKFVIGVGLVVWVVRSGKIAPDILASTFSDPSFLLTTIGMWLVGPVWLGMLRWRLLLGGIQIFIPKWKALELQLIGLFFNSTLPGSVSGDVVKTAYAIGDAQSGKARPILATILDRIIGLAAMFFIGAAVIAFHLERLWAIATFRPIIVAVFLIFFGIAASAICFLTPSILRRITVLVETVPLPGKKLALQVGEVFLALRSTRQAVWWALGISIIVQCMFVIYFVAVAKLVYPPETPPFAAKVVAAYPIAILIASFPLLPGGAGTGHVAFEEIFKLVGLRDGANIFNVYFVAFLVMNLLGMIPYFLRGQIKS